MRDPGGGDHRSLRIRPPLEPVRGLGVHAQGLRRASDGAWLPEGRLEGHRARLERDLARGPAHDAGEGERVLLTRHHPGAGTEHAVEAVERAQPLPLPRPANAQPPPADAREVEGMRGVAHLHHHVVGQVHQVVDGPNPDLLEPSADPRRGRTKLDVEDTRAEAGTQVPRLDHDVQGLLRSWPRLRESQLEGPERPAVERGDLARQPVDVHGIHAVGGDVDVEDGLIALALDPVEREADHRQVFAETAGFDLEIDVFAEPGDGKPHSRNCSKKRRSPP
ncbi:MAG: hypothetical protein A2V74_05750 [Acidobacteria bacterium RBG_16_70_10]|nr:MAG: hypothetical protein A2V74_05750 [Acidobacteria bacterium RBG_16_70_10]